MFQGTGRSKHTLEHWINGISTPMVSLISKSPVQLGPLALPLSLPLPLSVSPTPNMINRWSRTWPKFTAAPIARIFFPTWFFMFVCFCCCRELQIQLNKQCAMNARIFGNPSPGLRPVPTRLPSCKSP